MKARLALLTGILYVTIPKGCAQLTTGTLAGSIENLRGEPAAAVLVEIAGPPGRSTPLTADAQGEFSILLPYGDYTVRVPELLATCRAHVRPAAVTHCRLQPGENRVADVDALPSFTANNTAQLLQLASPGALAEPLDFQSLESARLPLLAGPSAAWWTGTSFRLNGLDATDSHRPGLPVMLDDLAAIDTVAVHEVYTAGSLSLDAYDIATFLRAAAGAWHFGLATQNTGAALSDDNLPPAADRGSVQRLDQFRWFTRDTSNLDGVFSRWADFAATATGQWASQTAPQRPDDSLVGSRTLYANIRGRVHLTARDQLDGLSSGSRIDLSNGGWPAGMEAFVASPLMPSFYAVNGFENLREEDHFDLTQAGWTHSFDARRVLELRYGYSTAHIDTLPVNASRPPPAIDLLSFAPADAPFFNAAIRTRHELAAVYRMHTRFAGMTHELSFGAAAEASQPRNRFHTAGSPDTITAAGQPAFTVILNTPTATRDHIDSITPNIGDTIRLTREVTVELALLVDHSSGRVAGRPASIAWTSASPRTGVAFSPPGMRRLVLRGDYARTYSRLAGRYLDFADPSALSGSVFNALSGALLERFGGAYSSIDRHLKRPYFDELHASGRLDLPHRTTLSIDLLRGDYKRRIAAANTGVPFSGYQPVVIQETAPFQGESPTVYAQSPATLGKDRYVLTNPAELREFSEEFTAGVNTQLPFAEVRTSFTMGRDFGQANPGSSAWENDPELVGSLYSNPNTLINASGHPFMDRHILGKFQTVTRAPHRLGGFELLNTINYLDGLAFARELLVTGLPQGPFFVNATITGSPEGGSRAEHVLNWNLRLSRDFETGCGRVTFTGDVLNLLNNSDKIVENDLSGPLFNQRLGLRIPPPRVVRLGARWSF